MIGVYISLFIINILCIFNKAHAQNDWLPNIIRMDYYPIRQQTYFMKTKICDKTVDLKLYYESLCPGCRELETTEFRDVVNILSPYLNIKTYPYGNAKTMETDQGVKFECQHGPKECYGNKLHGCSLRHIANHTQALLFNSCMMEMESDDAAATKCASKMNVDTDAIIQCAKGEEGIQLLKYYGEESKKANFNYVPYVLINGKEWGMHNHLIQDVCAAFKNPPSVCQQ